MQDLESDDTPFELPPVADLLEDASPAERETLASLVPRFYEELRQLARFRLRDERHAHTLNTTALVNEACLRLLENRKVPIENKNHFFYLAGRTMRHLLVEHARHRHAAKRGGKQVDLPLDEAFDLAGEATVDMDQLLSLYKALSELAVRDRRQAQIVELRFFAGMTNEEVAKLLDLTSRTIRREWSVAKLWLGRALEGNT